MSCVRRRLDRHTPQPPFATLRAPSPRKAGRRISDDQVRPIHDVEIEEAQSIDGLVDSADVSWSWQWVFPAAQRSIDPRSGIERRHHLGAQVIQRAVREAVQRSGITKAATPHTLRHSFCHPSAGRGTRHPHGAGADGARRRQDDDDQHTRVGARRFGRSKPTRRARHLRG